MKEGCPRDILNMGVKGQILIKDYSWIAKLEAKAILSRVIAPLEKSLRSFGSTIITSVLFLELTLSENSPEKIQVS